MKNYIILVIVLSLVQPGIALAQEDLQSLSTKLRGHWSGSGYQQMGQQNRVEFNQTEEITPLLNGKLLMVHGTGMDKDSGVKAFEAVGMMYYDISEKKVYMHAWTDEGRYTKAPVEVTESGFSWWFEVDNGGTVRYDATITGNSWIEKGAFSPDGNQWYPFMSMELSREN
jgi:hypothetical protein